MKELWTKEDSLKLAQEEIVETIQETLRSEDQTQMIRGGRPTDSNRLLMQWRGPYTVESHVGANNYRVVKDEDLPSQHVKEVHL